MGHNMRAVEITEPGGPQVLRPTTCPIPTPGHGLVRIKLAYAGVNRPDVLQRSGLYDPPAGASPLPGLECSGWIDAIGPGVAGFAPGDAVCALLPGGGYAEYTTTPAAHCLPVPDGMEMDQAACLPETYFTVWSNVFGRGGLQAGERFLVHGGTSGMAPPQSNWRGPLARGSLPPPGQMQNAKPASRWARIRPSTIALTIL